MSKTETIFVLIKVSRVGKSRATAPIGIRAYVSTRYSPKTHQKNLVSRHGKSDKAIVVIEVESPYINN